MRLSTKAALFSAFIAPGAGHLLLKRYPVGLALLGIACVALYVLVNHAVNRALEIVDQIANGEVQLDVAVITELVSRQPAGSEGQAIEYATSALIICWLAGIFDAYRVGRLQHGDVLRGSDDAADK